MSENKNPKKGSVSKKTPKSAGTYSISKLAKDYQNPSHTLTRAQDNAPKVQNRKK